MSGSTATPDSTASASSPGAARPQVDADEAAERLTSAVLAGGSGRLLRELLAPYKRALQLLVLIVVVENAARLWRSPTWSRSASTPASRRSGRPTTSSRCSRSSRLVLVATLTQAVARNLFLVRSGVIGQDVLLRGAPPGLPALPGAEPGLPRRLHLRAGDLAPDLRRRRHLRDARDRLRRPGHRRAHAGRHGGLLLFLDVRLGLVALLCGPFLALLTNWFRKASASSYRVTREKVALVIVHFVESMGGIRAVQAFRREPRNQEIFDDVNDQYRRANLVAFRLVAWFMPGIRLIGNVTIAVVLLYGGYLAYQGEVTVGVLAAFLLYLRQFFEPMMEISQFYNTFQSASAALEKLAGVLDEEPDVPEPDAARAGPRPR